MATRTSTASAIDGNHVLYHYLEKDLKETDVWLFQMLAARLFTGLGIWFSRELYAKCPILIPFAVRDPTCRPRRAGETDEWGAPNPKGFFRDDNSLVKALPRSLRIRSPANPLYDGRVMGNGFVAAHVWRSLISDQDETAFAARNSATNTFLPNLVWLPAQVAKLTDREGSFAQVYLQALAVKIYREVRLEPRLKKIADRSWDMLPEPAGIPAAGLPDPNELAYFEETEKYSKRIISRMVEVRDALHRVATGKPLSGKVVSTRYTTGLPRLAAADVRELISVLSAPTAAPEEVAE